MANPQTFDELGRAFEAFKTANDARLKEVEKQGAATADTLQNVAKAEAAIDDLKAKIEADVTALTTRADDLESKLNRKGLGGGAVDAKERAENCAYFMTVTSGRRVKPSDPDLDYETYDAYCRAFDPLVRRQLKENLLPADIRNAASVGSDPAGGYFVVPEVSRDIERRVHETSPVRRLARVIQIGSDAWEAPYRSAKGVSGGWVGETQARPATATATGGTQRIPVHELYAYPEITQKLLDDAMVDVGDLINEETADQLGRDENAAFVNGNGVNKPRGFLDYGAAAVTTKDASRAWGVLQYIASGAAGAFPDTGGSLPDNADALIDMISALNPVYRQGATWSMNRSTEATVRKLKDADGRYLVGFGDLRDSITGFNLLGFPIENFEDMPDIAADSFSIAFANWMRGYYVIDRIGLRLIVDQLTNKPYVGFYMTKRVGGDVRNFDAIKLMKFAAT